MSDQKRTSPAGARSIPPTPVAPVQLALISTDQYQSSTYPTWFERHRELRVDEALALGLAKRV